MQKQHLAQLILESCRRFADRPALKLKVNGVWQSDSYADLGAKIEAASQALLADGIGLQTMVGIFSQNRPEWTIADLAVMSIRAVAVPIYATNTASQAAYIAADCAMALVFVGDQKQYDKICAQRSPAIRRVVAFDAAVRLVNQADMHWDDYLALGRDANLQAGFEQRLQAAEAEDLATLIYTSGTTGDPKGAALSHVNMTHQFYTLGERFNVGPGDRSLSFLPLSHSYERAWSLYVLSRGACNYYLQDPKSVIDEMPEIRPTAMVSVPRLYEKIYAAVQTKLEHGSAGKQQLFNWALKVGGIYHTRVNARKTVGPWLALRHMLADKLVLAKIRDVVGGPKNFFSAGGAPLAQEIEEFFFAAGLLVCQGYGLTETAPMLTCNAPGSFRFGTVGRPILNCEIRIAADGEVLVRGANVMRGYYNKPAETAETIRDGWLHTGDIGTLDEDGFLRITGRIKDLIITAQGKNIAPLKIETLLGQDYYIEQIALIGDRRKFLSALVVPAFAALEEYASEQGIAFGSRAELLANPVIREFFEKRIERASVDLPGYEKVKRFSLLAKEFEMESGEITPTLKIKRHVIARRYKDIIDQMYSE